MISVEKEFKNEMSPKYASRENEMSDILTGPTSHKLKYIVNTVIHHSLCSQEKITAIGNV